MEIEEFLRQAKIPYEKKHHPAAYTAQEVAASAHVPGDMLAKTVVVRVGDGYALAVCPATHLVDLKKLSRVVGAEVRLANEGEMESLFEDAELGAAPPFGNLYGLATYVDESLSQCKHIVFQAGTHEDTIKVSYEDYKKAVEPEIADFTSHV